MLAQVRQIPRTMFVKQMFAQSKTGFTENSMNEK